MGIDLITGPMFAGKSLKMLEEVSKYYQAKYKCLLIRSKRDDRHSDNSDLTACTHNKVSATKIQVQFASTIGECLTRIRDEKIEVVGIDEGQFFVDLAETCAALAKQGVKLIIAALDGDKDKIPFACVSKLIPHCDSIVKLKGVCAKCHSLEAIFSSLLVKPSAGSDEFLVGGADKYESLCRKCYDREHANVNAN